jgi:hypothetical protein
VRGAQPRGVPGNAGLSVEHDDTQLAGDRTATAAATARSPAGDELPTGLRLDHFRIERKLGAGGMGEVYLATDLALDRAVAIKVLPAQATTGPARERLVREARAQARVQHPNVAHIYFIGEDAGRLYFAMELLAGKTLADQIADGPLAVEAALDAIRSAALGLREAQRAGFSHRDVKPSNLMTDGHGVVKVLDFGLVAAAPADAGDGAVAQTTLAGTPLYMAPEQASGAALDHRADIYALGATLYHLVAGKPPFEAATAAELATLHRTAERPGVPRIGHTRTAIAAIDALVARMMAPDPAERFATYDELLRALELASAAHTKPAGFWVRGMATATEAALVAIVLALVSALLELLGAPAFDITGKLFLPVMSVMQALSIGRWGTTPGKALFELEVAAVATGARPTWRQAIARSAVEYAAPFGLPSAMSIAGYAIDLPIDLPGIAAAAGIAIVVVLLVHAVLRVPGKRAPWDRAAGTIVRYRASSTGPRPTSRSRR